MKRSALAEVIRIGSVMSNICFNLAQSEGRVLKATDCLSMKKAQTEWDEALRSLRSEQQATKSRATP